MKAHRHVKEPTSQRGLMASRLTGLRSAVRQLAAPFLTGLALATVGSAANAADDTGVSGVWVSEDGAAIVEVAPCGKSAKRVCGEVVWAAENAEQAVGDTILKSFRPLGKVTSDKWVKGKVLVNGSRRGYEGKLDRSGDELKVSYCKGSTCVSNTWVRPETQQLAAAGLSAGS